MIKLIALDKQPPNPVDFDIPCFNSHLPLLTKIPGLLKTVITRFTRTVMGDLPYTMAEMSFPDKDTLKTGMESPEIAAAGTNLNSSAEGLVTLLYGVEETGR